MVIELDIQTADRQLRIDLCGDHPITFGAPGPSNPITPDVGLRYHCKRIAFSNVPPQIIDLTLEIVASPEKIIAWAVIADYLVKRLKGRIKQIKIGGREVDLDIDKVARALEDLHNNHAE